MGKDKQEDICFKNLQSYKCGKYANAKLGFLKGATVVDSWSESPDFLVVNNGKAYGIEHFMVDQAYVERRAGSRIVNEDAWNMYETYHKALEEKTYNSNNAALALEKVIQNAFDIATLFDYGTYMDQFDRIFDKHVKKIPRYLDNLNNYMTKELFFLIEVNSLRLGNNAIACVATREDGAGVRINANQVVLTERMIKKIQSQIGVLKGIILQNYSFFDIERNIKDMVYLDTSSNETFEESIKAQRIHIYKEYHIHVPEVQLKLDLIE